MKRIRYLTAFAFVFVMFLTASITHQNAIVFPEILALLIGLICSDKLPWKTDAAHTLILMTICAAAGWAIVNYIPLPMYFRALIGFSFAGLVIIITDCTLMPCLSAVLLPIYINDASPVYPCAVFVMVGLVLIIRALFIHLDIKEAAIKFHYTPNFEYDLALWLRMLAIYAIIAFIPMLLRELPDTKPFSLIPRLPELVFIIAPPLAVTLVEAFCRDMRGRRFRIWFVVTIAAVIGAMTEFIGVELLELTPAVPALIAAMLIILEMKLMNMMFPPAGAAALLAFPAGGNIFLYPPMIAAGCFIVLLLASVFGIKRGIDE